MTDPVSRTILLIDIENYSKRDDHEQAYLRRILFDITDRAEESAGIDKTLRLRADRGDSVMELIDARSSVPALLRALVTDVPAHLHAVNRMASASAQIRLRAVVAVGYVRIDEHDGWVGNDLNLACRLLDAELLRAALREREDDFALCVAEGVYQGIVQHDHPGVPKRDFHAVTMDSKNGELRAWLHGAVPAGAGAAGRDAGQRPAPAGTGTAGGRSIVIGEGATFGSGPVTGDQIGVSGKGNRVGRLHMGGNFSSGDRGDTERGESE